MDVLVTGASGVVGAAVFDGLGEDPTFELPGVDASTYDLHALDISDTEDRETYVASVADYEAIRPAFDGMDAVVHLAVYAPGFVDENFAEILRVNVRGTRNVLRAAADAEVESVVLASTNHVVGMYERDRAPDIYAPDHDLVVDHASPVRPDSTYGVSKLFNEHDGRFFVETEPYPKRCYAIRIASVRPPAYDHPYGDAEQGVDEGNWERGSAEYERKVRRLKATWFSRRDCAHMVDRCLRDESVEFGVFYGVSDNDGRWFDIGTARDRIGYEPRDNGGEWDGPPGR